MKLEYKTFPLEVKELSEDGIFEGYAAIFGKPDAFNETIDKSAFTKSLKENKQYPLLWFHDPRDPIGMAEVSKDEKGLKVKGTLNLKVQSAVEKYHLMKQKVVRGLSIGFKTIKDTWTGEGRILKEVRLFEVSPVTFQMQSHPEALILGVKSMEFEAVPKSLAEISDFLLEVKSGKMISAANLKLINNAVEALVVILKKLEPSDDTQDEKKGLLSPIVEVLGKAGATDKPQPHLFGSIIKSLEKS